MLIKLEGSFLKTNIDFSHAVKVLNKVHHRTLSRSFPQKTKTPFKSETLGVGWIFRSSVLEAQLSRVHPGRQGRTFTAKLLAVVFIFVVVVFFADVQKSIER